MINIDYFDILKQNASSFAYPVEVKFWLETAWKVEKTQIDYKYI